MYNIVSPNESIIKQIYYFAKHGINNVEQNNIEMLFREIEKMIFPWQVFISSLNTITVKNPISVV